MNLLVQKRFIFDVHDSNILLMLVLILGGVKFFLTFVDEWRHLPIFVTTYSYFFGALFMGLASIYYAASQKYDKFIVQGEVSVLLSYSSVY